MNGAREERGVLGGEKLIMRVVFDLVGSERNDVESVGYIERWGWGIGWYSVRFLGKLHPIHGDGGK